MKNGDGYLFTSIHLRALFGPLVGCCPRSVEQSVFPNTTIGNGQALEREDALPRKTVSKCREPSRRVYYGAAYEIKKEIPSQP
jgi:hypothetical protein